MSVSCFIAIFRPRITTTLVGCIYITGRKVGHQGFKGNGEEGTSPSQLAFLGLMLMIIYYHDIDYLFIVAGDVYKYI